MEPRLKTSRKWTPFPKELIQQVRSVFTDNFKAEIGKGQVEVDGRIYPEEILMSVGFVPEGGLRQKNFEVSLAYKRDKDNVLKLLHLGVDIAAALFEQLFQAEDDHDFPRLWQEIDFEGRKIHIQYTTVNTQLEAEADKILGEYAKEGLAQGEWDEDETEIDVDQIKSRLGLDSDEED